jgi:hypothetical protein
MKKAIITLIISLFSISPVSAQSGIISVAKNAAIEVVDSTKAAINQADTSSNFKMIYSDAKAGLEGLAKALKVGAEHVYVVLIKQQVVKSITWCALYLVAVFLIVVMVKFSKWAYKTYDSDSPIIIPIVFGWLGVLIFSIFCISNLDTVVTGFVNPEYGAMESIFDFVKDNTK